MHVSWIPLLYCVNSRWLDLFQKCCLLFFAFVCLLFILYVVVWVCIALCVNDTSQFLTLLAELIVYNQSKETYNPVLGSGLPLQTVPPGHFSIIYLPILGNSPRQITDISPVQRIPRTFPVKNIPTEIPLRELLDVLLRHFPQKMAAHGLLTLSAHCVRVIRWRSPLV